MKKPKEVDWDKEKETFIEITLALASMATFVLLTVIEMGG